MPSTLSWLTGALLVLTGATSALAQSINAIRSEISASPFMSSGPVITELEIRDGYLFATVIDMNQIEVDALRSNKPLSTILDAGPNIPNLHRLETRLHDAFDLKDIYWTAIGERPVLRIDAIDDLAKMLIQPQIGIGEIRIGNDFASTVAALKAETLGNGGRTKAAILRLGSANIVIFAEASERITHMRMTEILMRNYGERGRREISLLKDRFPRTRGGVGLGASRMDVIASMGDPESTTTGTCGNNNNPQEKLIYQGIEINICQDVVTSIEIK